MKKILLPALIFILNISAQAQQTFQVAIGSSDSEEGRAITRTSDGGYAVTGLTDRFAADSGEVYVVKLNSTGALQWTRTIGTSSYDAGNSIIQTTDGGYAIRGRTGYWTFQVYIIKLDSIGNLQWTRIVSNGLFDGGY